MAEEKQEFVIGERHCRAARAILGWTVADLAQKSGLSPDTIHKFEAGRTATTRDSTRKLLLVAFTEVGMEFYNGEEPGVRLRKRATL